MLHDTITFCRTLLLAGAIGVLTIGAAQAAPHGGGFHSGGFHPGGFHAGGIHSGFNGGIHPGFHPSFHPGFRGGLHHVTPFRSFRSFVSPYPLYPYSYSYSYGYGYPYYYGSGSSYPDYPTDSLDQSAGSSDEQGHFNLPRLAADRTAHVTVYVNPDAELWFDQKKTKAAGSVRQFVTPDLTPGHHYTYEVRAVWRENGHEVTQTRKAAVSAGADVEVDFRSAAPKER